MRKAIRFSEHAIMRLMQRSQRYGLSHIEARSRAIQAIRLGIQSKRRHIAWKQHHCTYRSYFKDGLSFYVICEEKRHNDFIECLVKTVIIEIGRE